MSDTIGGYQRPTSTSFISDTFRGHQNRTPSSTEPGTDYGCAYGSSLFAPEDGTVVDVKHSTSGGTGRYVTIDFNDGQRGRALHLSQVLVGVGAKVKRGQLVGKTGASANGKEWGVGAHVHQTLWSRHAYSFGRTATIDFERFVGADNDGPAGSGGGSFSQDVANRQGWLNQSRGEKLIVDGIFGDATRAAIKRYQEFLRDGFGYGGAIDGDWGNATQVAHQKYWDQYNARPTPPAGHRGTVADLKSLPYVNGLQKLAKLYGYKGAIDNDFGPNSQAALQRFLNQNYGGSLATWLRSKWGYADRDDNWGPNMAAAATRADTANWAAL